MTELLQMEALDQRIQQAKEYRARLVELAKIEDEINAMSNRLAVTKSKVVTKEVVHLTAAFYDVAPAAVFGELRTPNVVDARQTAMLFLMEIGLYSQSEVGRLMNRDHGTVFHAVRTVKGRCDVDPVYRRCVEELRAIVSERLKRKLPQCAQVS